MNGESVWCWTRKPTTHRVERHRCGSHDGLQVLGRTEAPAQPSAVSQDHREQPDDPGEPRLVGELDAELGEVDLGLPARRRLEATLEQSDPLRPARRQEIRYRRVTFGEAHGRNLAQEPPAGQIRILCDPLEGIRLEWLQKPGTLGLRLVGGRRNADGQCLPKVLRSRPVLRDGRHGETMPSQIMDHDDFPKSDHPALSRPIRSIERYVTIDANRLRG